MFQGKISASARVYCRRAGMFALTFPALLLTAASAFAQCTPTAPATVACTGTVTNQNSPNGFGTGVETGLTINVQAGATVTGTTSPGDGIAVAGGNTLNNLGAVAGPANNGIVAIQAVADTLTVNNNSSTATISGLNGVNGVNGSALVVNQGTITGTSNAGSAITAGVSLNVTNMGTGLIMSAGTGIDNGGAGGSVTVTNAGKIQATGNSIHAFGAITFTNTGTMVGSINGGTVNGSNSAIITGGVGAVRGDLTLTNSGTISDPIANSFGAGATAGNVTITSNSGTISGDVAGVTSSGNLTVTSNSGTLSGNATGITSGGNVTVTSNSGTISSSTSGIGASSFAINAGTETTDANVTNTSTGKIMAKEAAGGLQAIGILAKTATVNNAGLISASGPDAINDGINTTGLTTITNAATGTISSSSRSGVRVNNATITNDGLITGNEGIVFRNAGATGSVVNSGTITGTGGIAIDYGLNGSANPFTLTLEPGSVINGKVMSTVATTGLDSFQLGGSGSGTFDVSTLGPGEQYVGFSVFNKIGSSTWTLTGNSSFSGVTNVEQGVLVVNGSLASSIVTVASGATLGGSGTVGGLMAQNGSTVAPGTLTPFSTLDVTKNASFAAGTTFVVNVNSAGQNDKLLVNGTATLSGGTVQVVAGNGITPVSRYTILTAQGGVTGANLTTTSNLAFLSPVLSEDANDVFLGFAVTKVTFASVAITRNQIATANALQALGFGPVFNAVIGQSVAGARQAFDALSGEIHASTVTAAYEDALLPSAAILDRLNETVAAPVLGAATTTTGAYASDLPSGKGPRVAPVAVQLYQPRIFDVWGQGFGDWGRVSGDGNAASLSRSTGGFVLGGDVSASSVMGGDWRFGLAGGYTDDRISVSQRGSSASFESVFGGAYVGASFGALRLRAGVLYATNSTSTTRQATFPGFAEALSSSNGGSTAQAFGEAGYRIELSGIGLGAHASIEPFAGAAAFIIHQNGFTEEGGVSALTGVARDFDVQTTTLGVRGELAFATMPLTLKTMLGWRHAFGDVIPSTLLAFQGGAQGFRVAGVPIDRNAFVAEVGIDYAVTSMLSVGVSYSGQYGQRAMDNAVKAHLNLSF